MPGMQNMFNPMANIYQTQLEASRQFADALFSGTEKIDHVLLDATHRALSEQLKFVQSLIAVRDPQGVASAQAMFLSQRPDRVMDYQRELMQVFAEVQNDFAQSMRSYVEQLSTGAIGGATAAVGAAESQATQLKQTYNPMNNMFSVWESAFREMTSIANRNVDAARSTFENATGSAYENMTEAVERVAESSTGRERKSSGGNGKRK